MNDASINDSRRFSGTISSFRQKRGKRLALLIRNLSSRLRRPVNILDVGGRAEYWNNVGFDGIGSISILNSDETDLSRAIEPSGGAGLFEYQIGDARNLGTIRSDTIDLVHSNSVIEHVGVWEDMEAMASELRRVGVAGWVQTPAWEFPIEPHFRVPFMHWFSAPVRRKFLVLSKRYRNQGFGERRRHADRINLLSKRETAFLFPACKIDTERAFSLPKSYIITWDRTE